MYAKHLIVIAGPTASGKTGLAIDLAKHFGTEILSFDSRQVYREMRIGTAVPSREDRAGVPHYFIQSHSISQPLDAGAFAVEARACVDQLFARYPVVVAVGGTGLYLKAWLEGLDVFPEVDPGVRLAIRRALQQGQHAGLLEELREKDPLTWQRIDRNNPARIGRALEVIRSSGHPFSSFQQGRQYHPPFRVHYFAPHWPRETLYQRINQRVQHMLSAGLLEEADALFPQRHLTALQTVGYRELFDYREGKMDYKTAIEKIAQHTRHYARRQLTWFGRKEAFQWVPVDGQRPQCADIVRRLPIELQ